MTSGGGGGLGNRSLIVIIGLVASCITIFGFMTGWQTIGQAFSNLFSGSESADPQPPPSTREATSSQFSTPTVASSISEFTGANLGLIGEPFSYIASAQGVVYVATDGAKHGVFKSEDLGVTWEAANNGLLDFDIQQVEVSQGNPNVVYIVNGGLWRSEDEGSSWSITEYGRTCGNPRATALGSGDGMTVIWSNCGVLFVSRDGGGTWTEFGDFANIGRLVAAPSDPSVIYGLVRGHFDNPTPTIMKVVIGERLLPLANVGPGLDILDISVSHHSPEVLFAGTEAGVYRSDDGGGSWKPMNQDLPSQGLDLDCGSVEASPWQPSAVFAACNSQIYVSENLGENWTILGSPPATVLIHVLSDAQVLLAATEEGGLFSITPP